MSRRTRTAFLLVAVAVLAASTLLAAPPARRIADINKTPASQYLSDFTVLGDAAIFSTASSDSPEGGLFLLWRTDGTPEGTRSIGSVDVQGNFPGGPERVVLGGKVVFSGSTRFVCGFGLFTTDGTEAGTIFVRSFCDGSIESLVSVADRAFFTVRHNFDASMQLWVTDGTAEGTRLVSDLGNVPGSSSTNLVAVGTIVFFSPDDGVHGRELWRSDGTAEGTRLVADIWTGPGGSDPQSLMDLDGVLYFSAEDPVHGRELWKSDGTAAGTILVRDIVPGPESSGPGQYLEFQGGLVFTATDPEHGFELWRTDGTSEGTTLFADVAPGTASSYATPLAGLDDVLVVAADTPETGFELWRIDPTTSIPQLLRDIRPGPESSMIGRTVRVGNVLYFRADDGVNGAELWRTDGTASGTHILADIRPGPAGSGRYWWSNFDPLIALGQDIVLAADDGVHGYELFAVNASTGNVRLVRDLQPWTAPSKNWRPFFDFGGVAYFGADDGVHGEEIWRSDGTAAGTAMVADLAPGEDSDSPNEFVVLGDQLLFGTSSHLWSLRGGSDEVTMLDEGGAGWLTPFASEVWYQGQSPTFGRQLFRTDGTPEGTGLAIVVGQYDSAPSHFHAAWDGLIFGASGWSTSGREPWYANTNTYYSFEIGDLAAGTASSNPDGFTHLPGSSTVWFTARTAEFGRELWRVEDSLVPTLVKDIWPGLGSGSWKIVHLWPDGRVLLIASDPDHGCELWVSDGSSEGTVLVRDIAPEDRWGGTCPRSPAPLNGTVYFMADDGVHGEELWKTDGTPEGTVLFADLEPGPEGSSPSNLLVVDGRIVFSATTHAQGTELWVTDGTESGTQLFQDLRPGVGSGDPSGFSVVDDRVFFKAFDEEAGYEPWSFRRCRLPGADTLPPEGAITAPTTGTCFGPSAVPVVVADSFADRCDEEIVRAYTPAGGPSYSAHGDVMVNVLAADSAGNTASATRAFTIDLVPPVVNFTSRPRLPSPLPGSIPFSLVWKATDADGATGGVTSERVFIDNCLLWDGVTYGDHDGLLSDETLVLGREELCTLARTCGVVALRNPKVRVEARDCGGNSGSASATLAGTFRIPTRMCDR